MDYLQIFDVILQLSITGSILVCLILLIRKLIKKTMSKTILYYMWVILLVKLLLPFGPESKLSMYNLFEINAKESAQNNNQDNLNQEYILPNEGSIVTEDNEISNSNILTSEKFENNNSTYEKSESNLKKPQISIKQIGFFIWIIGAISLMGYTLLNYMKFKINAACKKYNNSLSYDINKVLQESLRVLSIKKNIEITISDNISSPTLYGLIKPRIVIPKKVVTNSSSEELKYILLHELCHYKRKDIIIAWVISFLKIIYWFNPIIIIALDIMRKDCETSCDEMVLSYLGKNENLQYGNTILNVLQYVNRERYVPGTTSMVTNKKNLKERITNIAKNKKLGVKTIAVGVAIILILGVIGLTNKISQKTIKLSIDTSKIEAISIVAMPTSPKEKLVYKKEDIDKIINYINQLNLKEKIQENYKGWEFRISTEGQEAHSISVVGETFEIDGIQYKIDKKELEKIRAMYNNLSYEEREYGLKNKNNQENTGYKEFTDKVKQDGYKVLVNSGYGLPIMLPASFDAIINDIEIGNLLYERNIESIKNGYDITNYLGQEAEMHGFSIDDGNSEMSKDIIGIVSENKLVAYWETPSYTGKGIGDKFDIVKALQYDKIEEDLSYINVIKGLMNKGLKVDESSGKDKAIESGYSARIYNIKVNDEEVTIYEYIDDKAAQSDATLINDSMLANYTDLVIDLGKLRSSKNVYLNGKILCLYDGDKEDVKKGLEAVLDKPLQKLSRDQLEILDYKTILRYPAEWGNYKIPTEIVLDNISYNIDSKDIVREKNIFKVNIDIPSEILRSFDEDEIIIKWKDLNIKNNESNTMIKREDILRTKAIRDKFISKINKVDLSKEKENTFTVTISYDIHSANEQTPWFAGNGVIGDDNWILDKFCFVDIEKIGENKYRMISSYTG